MQYFFNKRINTYLWDILTNPFEGSERGRISFCQQVRLMLKKYLYFAEEIIII